MPCCHIPNATTPLFPPSLQPDAERFSRFGGGAPLEIIGAIAPLTVLTSAVHLEMKLWNTGKQLPRQYCKNDAEQNSWIAMRGMLGKNTFKALEKTAVFESLNQDTPVLNQCVLTAYDYWFLETILRLKTLGRDPGRNPELRPGYAPSTLSTVGSCQKLLNVFLKYELCWQVAGQWVKGHFFSYAHHRSPNLSHYLCALHAPIDSFLLKAIVTLPLGSHLVDKGFLRKPDGYLRQSIDDQFSPWSKLDCLRTYYGLQLILRRIAMHTWTLGCACRGASGESPAAAAKKLTQDCADWFEKTFGPKHQCKNDNIDWIKAACELKDEVIEKTLEKLRANATDSGSGGSAPAALRTNPSSCESSGKDQPASPSSDCQKCDLCDLGDAILAEHRRRLVTHPRTLPPVDVAVAVQHGGHHRIRCSSAYGWAWHYHVNLKTVRVDLFSEQGPQAAALNRYTTFCAPRVNPPFPRYPPFPPGIIGNGTRSIRKSTQSGANAGSDYFSVIARDTVDIMQQIFTTFNPRLP